MSRLDEVRRSNEDALKDLQPQIVWGHFAKLAAIPRGSTNETEVKAYIEEWTKNMPGVTHVQDKAGNLFVYVPGRGSLKNAKPIGLQSHLDIVHKPETHDFNTNAVEVEISSDDQGEWVQSKGRQTTLGADNGIGVATMMAIAQDQAIEDCPPLELIFTVDEETGMTGVEGIDASRFSAEQIINLDGEMGDGRIGIGNAGARWFDTDRADQMDNPSAEKLARMRLAHIDVSQWAGGHSGLDIHKDHGNAIKEMAQVVADATSHIPQAKIVDMEGGSDKWGIIPTTARARVLVPNASWDRLGSVVSEADSRMARTIKGDPKIGQPKIELVDPMSSPVSLRTMQSATQRQVLAAMNQLPDGVINRGPTVDQTETSSNLAKLTSGQDGNTAAKVFIRGHDTDKLDAANAHTRKVLSGSGFRVDDGKGYNEWKIRDGSPLKAAAIRGAVESGLNPTDFRAHCGLEIETLLGEARKHGRNPDAVFVGPLIEGAHSESERIDIASCARFVKHVTRTVQLAAESQMAA